MFSYLVVMLVSIGSFAVVMGILVATIRALGGGGPRRLAALEAEVAALRRQLDSGQPGAASAPAMPQPHAAVAPNAGWPQLQGASEYIVVRGLRLPAALVAEVRRLGADHPVGAVKLLRERTGLGLADAKATVDDILADRY